MIRFLSLFVFLLSISNLGFATLSLAANEKSNILFSASGADGKEAVNGRSGADATSTGGRGDNGGDATPPANGQNAGNINLSLSKSSVGEVLLKGYIDVPLVRAEKNRLAEYEEFEPHQINQTLNLGLGNKIELYARGGDGKNGGIGGSGGDGETGRRGRDATRLSTGSNGGPGGDGGDAGAGTSASDSGKGGVISVSVSADQTDLLLLIGKTDIDAGAPGRAGQHGTPGDGAEGGSGGSSHSWTTPRCSGTGNNRTCTDVRHSNPGGWDGSDGEDGKSVTTTLLDGKRAADGVYSITVVDGTTRETYKNRYSLRIKSFRLQSEDNDNVIEPGELVTISNIVVANEGDMPMPMLPVNLRVIGTGLEQVGDTIQMQGSLPSKQTQTLEGQLKFRVRDVNPVGKENRFAQKEIVTPIGRQEGVDRDHESSPTMQDFIVTFPIEMTPIRVPKSLAPGQSAKISWKIKNISGLKFGANSDLKRLIATQLNVDSKTIRTNSLIYRDSTGQEIILNKGFMEAIDQLGPNEERIIEGFVAIHPEAKAYSKVNITTGLEIGHRENPSTERFVQSSTATINVSFVFKKTPGSDVLLVTNGSTQTEELVAWTQAFATLGLQADVWDLSYEGFLDLARPLPNHSDAVLTTLYKDGLIIILDYDLPEDYGSQKIRPTQMLNRARTLEAVRKANLNFLFVSNDRRIDTGLLNQLASNANVSAQKPELYETGFPIANSTELLISYFAETKSENYQATSMDLVEESWFEPSEQTIVKRADALSERLKKIFPTENFLVSYRFNGSKVNDPSDWFRKHYHVGTITVYPSLSRTRGGLFHASPKSLDIHDPAFITSRANLRTLIQSLPLREKVKNWIAAMKRENMNAARLSADAIFYEVWDEQKAILDRWGKGNIDEQFKSLSQVLKLLREGNFKLKSPNVDPEGVGQHFLDYMAALSYGADMMLEENGKFFGLLDGSLRAEVNRNIEECIKQVFGENLPSDSKFKAFFGVKKSSDADIEEQQFALDAYEEKKEKLKISKEDNLEPLYWLLGDSGVRKMYDMDTSSIEATSIVEASLVNQNMQIEVEDVRLRLEFENKRKSENSDLLPELIDLKN